MSRSVRAFTIINPRNFIYPLSIIANKHGFVSRTEYGEDVFVRETDDNDVIQYIKFSYSETALAVSIWIRYKSDENNFREYAAGQFEYDEYEKVKDICETLNEIEKTYGDRLKERKVRIYYG